MTGVLRNTFLQIIKNNNKLFLRTYINYCQPNARVLQNISVNSLNHYNSNLSFIRCKHDKKNKKKSFSESDEDQQHDDFDEELIDKQTKLMTVQVNSLRADLILKAGLGIARNKIETMFYESKIRVNGKKLPKKSAMLNVGDEIDIVKGLNITNPNFLTVSRVEILSAIEKGDGLSVKLRRNKSLTIENYDVNK